MKYHLRQEAIPSFWSDCQRDGSFAQLAAMDTADLKGMFGIFCESEDPACEDEYCIMVVSGQEAPPGFTEYQLPAVTWAIFDCRGSVPEAIQKGWKFLQEEWLLKYPFQHAACPEVEWYSSQNAYARDYLSQIWIPVHA